MGSEQNRFLLPHQSPTPRRKRWGGCLGGLSCFREQKGGKRIVPASRMPAANAASNQPNGPQAAGGLIPNNNQSVPSLYAPPSSPASFSNSALPSTAQSPTTCFLSASSPPGGPSSTMFATGPYAHETQLVSPPVFSTFTTEPSTAPLTPPPELAHYLTTPSSPDVPYACFLSNIKTTTDNKTTYNISVNDLQSTYSLYPGSPTRSPVSLIVEREWDPSLEHPGYTKSESGRFIGGIQPAGAVSKSRQDSNFFCPETFAQFYLDQSSFSHSGGRLSISRESDNGHQNRQSNKVCKPDPEELEAYRASFGFSADEIITTTHYVEISDVLEDSSFTMTSCLNSSKPVGPQNILTAPSKEGGEETKGRREDFPRADEGMHSGVPGSYDRLEVKVPQKRFGDVSGLSIPSNHIMSNDDDDLFSKMGASRIGRKYPFGSSNSDAEIEYSRGRSLRDESSCRES